MNPHELRLRIILFQENNMWIAQCLDYDFATQGQSTRIALDALERLIAGQIALDVENQLKPLQNIPQAPKEYFDMKVAHLADSEWIHPMTLRECMEAEESDGR